VADLDKDTNPGSGDLMNVQSVMYTFIVKLDTPDKNKTSYCPIVSTYKNTIIIVSYLHCIVKFHGMLFDSVCL